MPCCLKNFAALLLGSFLSLAAANGAPLPGTVRLQFKEPRSQTYLFERPTPSTIGIQSATAPAGSEWTRGWTDTRTPEEIEFGSRVVLQVTATADLASLLKGRPLTVARELAERLWILQAPDSFTALAQAAELSVLEEVRACYPISRRQHALLGRYAPMPNDPYFFQAARPFTEWQPYLEHRDEWGRPIGIDLNVRAAWPFSQGKGVAIGIADDGFELNHPDLKAAAAGMPHFNFHTSSTNGNPPGASSDHGTAVAGLAAATGNNQRGIAGVAPQASLASWVIFDANHRFISNEGLMDLFQYQSNVVAVQNHSWGKVIAAQTTLSTIEDLAIENAVRHGRDGKGVVFVRAGGNERTSSFNANDDGYAQDPRVIAAAAVRLDGRVTSYSSPGACILVAAPSGDSFAGNPCLTNSPSIMTTDRQGTRGMNKISFTNDLGDYAFGAFGFSGTSASAPQISGIAALMLAANPDLTYRDVQQIFVHSGRHLDLADPTLTTNGAGFRVSHNLGYGVPDAGFAVELARRWINRPPLERKTFLNTEARGIPERALTVVVQGSDVPPELTSIRAIASLGAHPEPGTPAVPIVDVGQALEPIPTSLSGRAALIQRGENYFCEKIDHAARAGAAFALIYNNRDGDALLTMGGTDLSEIPAVLISQNNGEALLEYVQSNPEARVRLQFDTVDYVFEIDDAFLCEHIGLRLDTLGAVRGDLRITLTSPSGTRSVLQHRNTDDNLGPIDRTYYSAQHFYESSAGLWTLSVSDEGEFGGATVQLAELIITGVPIQDSDRDGLDDAWELKHFGTLKHGPADDPDEDGYSNMREQILGTNPAANETRLELDLSIWNEQLARVSWPSNTNTHYQLQVGRDFAAPMLLQTNLMGRFPETEVFLPYTDLVNQFFRLQIVPPSNSQ